MEGLIFLKGFCGMREVCFRYPGVFFGRIPFSLDQEEAVSRSSSVAQDPVNFIFFFSGNKVRWWFQEIWTVYGVFTIGR